MQKNLCSYFFFLLVCFFVVTGTVYANEYIGWEAESPYNQLYQVSDLDRIKGKVVKTVDIVPMKGMAPGVGLIIRDELDDQITVHIGPKAFVGENIGLRRGDTVKIRGSWADIDGQDVFMAAKIKKGEHFSLKVRLTKTGTPFWTLSPEDLARERAAE